MCTDGLSYSARDCCDCSAINPPKTIDSLEPTPRGFSARTTGCFEGYVSRSFLVCLGLSNDDVGVANRAFSENTVESWVRNRRLR